MIDQGTQVADGDGFLRQAFNLEIAGRKAISLNAPVDLPCIQTGYLKLPASATGVRQ